MHSIKNLIGNLLVKTVEHSALNYTNDASSFKSTFWFEEPYPKALLQDKK